MYLDKAKQQAKGLYPLTGWKPTPCTLEEVEELERWCGHHFPCFAEIATSQRGRDFFQTAQELAIAEPLKDWPRLSQGSLVAGTLREDDPHTGRVRD